jgi:hypothetical protein
MVNGFDSNAAKFAATKAHLEPVSAAVAANLAACAANPFLS